MSPFTNLKQLSFEDGVKLPEAGLKYLGEMKSLKRLWLPADVTDKSLAHLQRLPNLESLSIKSQYVTDAGLAHLSQMKNLSVVWLLCPKITDKGLEHLRGLAGLKQISLRSDHVTDKGLKHFKKLSNLSVLALFGNTLITEQGEKWLEKSLPDFVGVSRSPEQDEPFES